MNHRKLLYLSISSALALGAVAGSALISTTLDQRSIMPASATEPTYQVDLNPLCPQATTRKTSNGNTLEFALSNFDSGVFSVGVGYIENVTPISGLQAIRVSFKEGKAGNISVSYKWSSGDDFLEGGVLSSSNEDYDFNDERPTYFRLSVNTGSEISLNSIDVEYSCNRSDLPGKYAPTYSLVGGDHYAVSGHRANPTSAIIPAEYNGLPVTSINQRVFDDCATLESLTFESPSNIKSIDKYAFQECNIANLTLPEGLETIGNRAFCTNRRPFDSVYLPSTLKSIGELAFNNANDYYFVVNNLKDYLSLCYSCRDSYNYIGNGRRHLLDKNNDNAEITSIDISSSMAVEIPDHAFEVCNNIVSLTLEEGVTSIGNDAFRQCASLSSITFPSSLTSIGSDAFYASYAFESITYSGTEDQWKAIDKASDWINHSITVHCTNGEIKVNE